MQAGIEDNDNNAIDDFTNSLNKGIGEHLNTNNAIFNACLHILDYFIPIN
jgi:hypothetical protein